jgi:hypothetical protein
MEQTTMGKGQGVGAGQIREHMMVHAQGQGSMNGVEGEPENVPGQDPDLPDTSIPVRDPDTNIPTKDPTPGVPVETPPRDTSR